MLLQIGFQKACQKMHLLQCMPCIMQSDPVVETTTLFCDDCERFDCKALVHYGRFAEQCKCFRHAAEYLEDMQHED